MSRLFHQCDTPLLSMLHQWANRDYVPFHTPGHRQGRGASLPLLDCLGLKALQSDLPELPELDNLFAPQGVIWQAQKLAAEAFGAENSYFLTNGSTSGVVAALWSVGANGGKVILPRNVHQSAISGLILSGAIPIFMSPDYDERLGLFHGATSEGVATALQSHPDAQAVFIVSPSYFGVVGDVGAIATLAHQHQIPLLVDEAHGAHFVFHPQLPPSALQSGADVSVQSTHKTLSALTQAAMLHVQGHRIKSDRLHQALQMFQSSSPNYLLLASLDGARQQMATVGHDLMHHTISLANSIRHGITQLPKLRVLSVEDSGQTPGFVYLDPTRITIDVGELGITGYEADQQLHQRLGVTAELATHQHLTLIITPGTTPGDCVRLLDALSELTQVTPNLSSTLLTQIPLQFSLELALSPREAVFSSHRSVPLAQACNHISADLICPYPPGIPALIPGEVITPEVITGLQQIIASGGWVTGGSDPSLKTMRVVQ